MSRTFKIPKNPYDTGCIYKKSTMTFEPGLTVLVGCNGSGKTTLFRLIKEKLNGLNVPVFTYDNKTEGASTTISRAVLYGQVSLAGTLALSSEGEQIMVCLGETVSEINRFIKLNQGSKEMWILLDAIDSGFSIDNIIDFKTFIYDTLLPDVGNDSELYILCAANSYEMANGEKCFDVTSGKYISFENYEDYKKFVLTSRKNKDKRFANEKEN